MSESRVRENRTHGSMRRREAPKPSRPHGPTPPADPTRRKCSQSRRPAAGVLPSPSQSETWVIRAYVRRAYVRGARVGHSRSECWKVARTEANGRSLHAKEHSEAIPSAHLLPFRRERLGVERKHACL